MYIIIVIDWNFDSLKFIDPETWENWETIKIDL